MTKAREFDRNSCLGVGNPMDSGYDFVTEVLRPRKKKMFRSLSLLLIVFLYLSIFSGCQNQNANQPVDPKVSPMRRAQVDPLDQSKLIFPPGYPKEITLYEPVAIYEQDDENQPVTWDTTAAVDRVRDYYEKEFKRLGFETVIVKPKGMPGENYEVRAFDGKKNKAWCVGVGQQRPEGSVNCFIYALDVTRDDWKTKYTQ